MADQEDKPLPNDTKSELHDDEIIDITNDRIQQELTNISADELKSSFLIGISATLLGILFTIGSFNDLIKENILNWAPIALLMLNCIIQIAILFPRDRLMLMIPRILNDDYGNKELSELKKEIKNSLIKNFEYIANSRRYDGNVIRLGFGLLFASIVIFIWILANVD